MFDGIRASWNRKVTEWTARISRAADEREAARRGEKAEPEVSAANIPPTMPNRLLTIKEQRELGLLANQTSKYTPSFDDRCVEADKAAEGAPPFITVATFVGGQPGVALIDPRDGSRVADRMISDATRKYGLKFGFSPKVPRL
jgi:hypothetical protein